MKKSSRAGPLTVGLAGCLLGLIFTAAYAVASPEQLDQVPLPASVPLLPSPDQGGESPVRINSSNVQLYHDIMIPELEPLIRQGILELNGSQRLRYLWRRDDEWERNTREFGDRNQSILSPQGALPPNFQARNGLPFGTASQLMLGTAPSLAQRILWNVTSFWWPGGALKSSLRIQAFQEGAVFRRMQVNLVRVYPSLLKGAEAAPSIQLFRERLDIEQPTEIKGLSWLSVRFFGAEEDLVWSYSPAIGKYRQLTGSNRSDPFARTSLSTDDLLMWSGKTELVEPAVQGTVVALVPYAALDSSTLQQEEGACATIRPAAAQEELVLPVGALGAVPRELWKLLLVSRDPYSQVGRQVLYVDQTTMAPVVRVVYDRAGQLWKTLVGVYGFASSSNRLVKFPWLKSLVVVDHQRHETWLIETSEFTRCSESKPEFEPRAFNPAALWPQAAAPTAVPAK